MTFAVFPLVVASYVTFHSFSLHLPLPNLVFVVFFALFESRVHNSYDGFQVVEPPLLFLGRGRHETIGLWRFPLCFNPFMSCLSFPTILLVVDEASDLPGVTKNPCPPKSQLPPLEGLKRARHPLRIFPPNLFWLTPKLSEKFWWARPLPCKPTPFPPFCFSINPGSFTLVPVLLRRSQPPPPLLRVNRLGVKF